MPRLIVNVRHARTRNPTFGPKWRDTKLCVTRKDGQLNTRTCIQMASWAMHTSLSLSLSLSFSLSQWRRIFRRAWEIHEARQSRSTRDKTGPLSLSWFAANSYAVVASLAGEFHDWCRKLRRPKLYLRLLRFYGRQ